MSTTYHNMRGYEAVYDPETTSCRVQVRGYKTPDGKIVERGGINHPDDKVVAELALDSGASCAKVSGALGKPGFYVHTPIRETFHDAMLDHRDLVGAPIFRHKPGDDTMRRYFAAAYDAAQKIRAKTKILGVNRFFYSLHPGLFAFVDCYARDADGSFWLMSCTADDVAVDVAIGRYMTLAAYVLEAGEYVPANAKVRLGCWRLLKSGADFVEIANDRIAARDMVIAHLQCTPF